MARDRKIVITIKNDIVYEDKLDEYVKALKSYSLGQHSYKVEVEKEQIPKQFNVQKKKKK